MSEQWHYNVTNGELEDLFRAYCTDYTALARLNRFGPITGRDKEVEETILILLQKGRKNAVLLAPAGVGKTAMVVALAQRIAEETVPDYLKDARVLEVELARMAAGTSGPAEFQERFIPLCKGVAERYHNSENPRIILFIDEIHQIMPNCTGSSYAGLSDVMKPYLTAGDLMVIGATTLDEFRMYVAEDPALERRFQKVFLKTPNAVETYQILKALRPSHEKHHGVNISNNNLMLIINLCDEHMRKRSQPDKAIITMDAAMAYHVKTHGRGSDVTPDSIYYMVARETGLNKQALHDEKKLQRILKQVAELEAEGHIYFI
ncbi:MAG: ATP-dependent Clp protease ATP-binding subunit [Alphaproteobacteria bacterium]|nr:ATP-dependent Clp protease ATP-binding subunit [Alphaproteobacteria bacterium]